MQDERARLTDLGARGRRTLLRVWWLGPPLLVALTYLGSPGYDFVADARFLILENRYLDDWGRLWGNLTHDYFWSSSGNFIPYWRPFTKLSWLVEAQLFRRWAGGFHLVQVGWHLLGVGGVVFLARVLGAGRPWAAVAGLVYGLHPAAAEPTCFLMARSDVVAATASVWAAANWLRWRGGGRRVWLVLHAAALVAAFASKESSLVLLPLLAGWALLERAWTPSGRVRPWTLAPVATAAIVYLVLRQIVLSGHDGPAFEADPLRLLAAGGRYLLALLPLRPTSGIRSLSFAEAHDPLTLAAALGAWLAVCGGLAWAIRRRFVAGAALLVWLVGALLPVLLVADLSVPGVEGKYPLADRWLLPATAAWAVLLGVALGRVRSPRLRLGAGSVCGLWLVAGFFVAPAAHDQYRDEAALMAFEEREYRETPAEFRTEEDDCRHEHRMIVGAMREESWEEVIRRSASLPRECRTGGEDRFNLLSALVEAGRMEEARPVAEALLQEPPSEPRFLGPLAELAGRTLLATGEPARAEGLFLEALRRGATGCVVRLGLAQAAAAMGRAADAAERFESTAACQGESGEAVDPALLLTAGYWWTRAGRPAEASRILERVRASSTLSPRDASLAADLERRIAAGNTGP